ncbi:hypothetical protein [Streptomyces celluloflavus]|uniref:hypothetical protein n=1 Tax=Streptomyces celluloflavus TaxID=58344 RepID=UPI00368219BA
MSTTRRPLGHGPQSTAAPAPAARHDRGEHVSAAQADLHTSELLGRLDELDDLRSRGVLGRRPPSAP